LVFGRFVRTSACRVPLFYGCSPQKNPDAADGYRSEIIETERAFAEMAAAEGLQAAFAEFAAEDAVIQRNDSLIRGRAAIAAFYADPRYRGVELAWSPERIDVSACGDLGYTWGSYTFTATDSLGATHRSGGIFHTVWKRQPDGSWKFVWD
jgi:ketosteroid isomerase-like protein